MTAFTLICRGPTWGIPQKEAHTCHLFLTFLHFLFLLEHLSSLGHDVGISLFTEAQHRHTGLG